MRPDDRELPVQTGPGCGFIPCSSRLIGLVISYVVFLQIADPILGEGAVHNNAGN